MPASIVKLFTQPNFAWTDIRREEEAHPGHYLAHLPVPVPVPVTITVSMILLWFDVLTPECLRATVG